MLRKQVMGLRKVVSCLCLSVGRANPMRKDHPCSDSLMLIRGNLQLVQKYVRILERLLPEPNRC
jgi:hypothetical protein